MNKAIRLFNLQFYQTFIGKKGNCTMLRKQKAACVRLKKVYNRITNTIEIRYCQLSEVNTTALVERSIEGKNGIKI